MSAEPLTSNMSIAESVPGHTITAVAERLDEIVVVTFACECDALYVAAEWERAQDATDAVVAHLLAVMTMLPNVGRFTDDAE